jgi:uncharacterized delta-60 repeat protein
VFAGIAGVSRYNTDGSIDSTFATNGTFNPEFIIASIAVQTNDKIIVAGTSGTDFALARYDINGSPDNTFSGDGKLITDFDLNSNDLAISVAIQNDGKIVLLGRVGDKPALLRYKPDGTLDDTFDGDGKVKASMVIKHLPSSKALLIQPDGKIVATIGTFFEGGVTKLGILRYDPEGTPDKMFKLPMIKASLVHRQAFRFQCLQHLIKHQLFLFQKQILVSMLKVLI